jgi:hypothetical protein
MKDELVDKIKDVVRESRQDFKRLHGQKRALRSALYDIRDLNIHNKEIEEIIRKTLVLTFG